jgi:octaprenyl-diphosphate synthase
MTFQQSPSEKKEQVSSVSKEDFAKSLMSLEGLKLVDDLIKLKFQTQAPILNDVSKYLFTLGGKKIRPALCFMVARCFSLSEKNQSLVDIATGIELIHMATLLHDDIIDKSQFRRGAPSALVKYGMDATLIAGDFLLTRAFALCARLDSTLIDATETACIELTEGESLELPLYKKVPSREEMYEVSRKKTASLFRLATFSAAHIANLSNEEKNHVALFGEHLGIAFQILDDILDVVSDKVTLGKEPGSDIQERKPSFVNCAWLNSNDKEASDILLSDHTIDEDIIQKLIAKLKDSKVVAQVRDLARIELAKAQQHLEVANSSSKCFNIHEFENLKTVIDYTVSRLQ